MNYTRINLPGSALNIPTSYARSAGATKAQLLRALDTIQDDINAASDAGYRADLNPISLPCGLTVCGPTTGDWVSANDLSVIGYCGTMTIAAPSEN